MLGFELKLIIEFDLLIGFLGLLRWCDSLYLVLMMLQVLIEEIAAIVYRVNDQVLNKL